MDEVERMEGAEEELERRSKFLNSLIQKKKKNVEVEQKQRHHHHHEDDHINIRVRAFDMSLPLQNHAFKTVRDILHSMKPAKLDNKRLALSLKKVSLSLFQ